MTSYCLLTCTCGHTADLDAFTTTPVYGQLPKNTFQCPACRRAIERRMGKPILHPSGWVQPGDMIVVPVDGRL